MDITTLPFPAVEMTEKPRLQIIEEILKEVMTLKNHKQLAAASYEDLMKELLSRFLNERAAGRAIASSDEPASDQQLKDTVVAAATKEKKSVAKSKSKKKKPRKQKKAGGFISLKLIAFGSIVTLIFSLSFINQSGGSGEGEAPPASAPSASRYLRQTKHQHQSDNDNAASPEVIISPLPASSVAPPPIFSPAASASSNRRMKFDNLRSATCFDTPNWVDVDGYGCDIYERNDECAFADQYAGDMGPATENCCYCDGGSVSLPPTNSPSPSSTPTKSASPSSSFKPSSFPTKSTPSTSPTHSSSSFPSISSNPTEFCLDTPNWKDRDGQGCDHYESFDRCDADWRAGDMGPATTHCCVCQGDSRTCQNYRSTCQNYFNIVGIEDGVMSPLCEEAESCSCGNHDVRIFTDNWGDNLTDGLYNECKCDFWSRVCEDSGVGEACDYAAEYCCGDYETFLSKLVYRNSPTCYCDFSNYARREFQYTLKPKAMNISKEFFDYSCSRTFKDEKEKTSLEAIYNETKGWNWTKNDGWMNETVDHCQWYGISCNDFGKIIRIDLRNNNLVGQFPVYTYTLNYRSSWRFTKYGLANLYRLESIDLAGNKLTGTIDYRPLYNLAPLEHFDVSGNQLSGGMDALVSPSIVHSDFSNNNFTSMRRFDKYKGSYQTLRFCDVSNNAIQINTTDRLGNIPPNIEQFFAQNNQIYGSFPDSINDLSHLRQFDMSSNAISGSLSESLNNLPQLRYFNMSSNSLTGGLPESLNNLPQLRQFDISSNTFSGQFPDFAGSFLSLQEIDVSNQAIGFTGSIPEDLARLQSLKVLKLAGNKLTGTISPSIGNIAVLEMFNVTNNLLSSTIPPQLGLLDGVLKRLDLSNNALSGVIPAEIGQLQGALILLEGNLFSNSSEAAPLSLCSLSSVEVFDLANDTKLCPMERNVLNDVYESAKGVEWTDRTKWVDEYESCCNWKGVTCENDHVTMLNLRNNGLSGKLSESIGNLTALEVLDLSDNDIKGSIPTQIGLLSNLTYLRLSYNAFTGTAPNGLGNLTKLKLLQLQSNRITKMPDIPPLDESEYRNSTFVTDCGVPSAFTDPMECEHCTMCCNANEDCYPQEDTQVEEWGFNTYGTFAVLLIPCFIVFCCMGVVSLCLFREYKNKNRENTLTMSQSQDQAQAPQTQENTSADENDKSALKRIGKDSVYSYIVIEKAFGGWLVAFATLAIQVIILIFFVNASEADLQDDKIDIQFTWKCPRDSAVCRNTADLNNIGWFIFCMLMIAHLAKDLVNGFKLMYYSSRVENSCWSWTRFRYIIGGIGLCSITLFAIYVSTVYNKAIATSNTEIILNSVVVLFIMDLDEYIFALLEACNEKWTEHASDSEDTSSSTDDEAKNESSITKMKEEVEIQKTQIESQQEEIASQKEEIGILRSQQEELMLQRDQVARQNDEIAILRGIVQQMQDSLEQFIPQSQVNESATLQTTVLKDDDSERDAARDGSLNEVEDLNTSTDCV